MSESNSFKSSGTGTLSRRKMLKWMAGGAAGALLAACSPAATEAPKSAVTSAPAATKVPPAKEVTLKFLSPELGSGVLEWFEKEVVPSFATKNPGLKVEFISSDYGKINEQLLAGFAAGDPPDLFEHGSAASGASWAASGQTLALDTYFKTLTNTNDYYDVALKTAYFGGKLFSMPRLVEPTALIYRKDFFKEAGLDPEKPPKTWEELRDTAKKLTKVDGGKMTRAGYDLPTTSWGGVQMGWFPFLHQNGASILTEDMKSCGFDTDAGIEAMTYYHDLLWKEKVSVLGGIPTGEGSPNAVVAGVAAMGCSNPSALVHLKKNFQAVIPNFGVAQPTTRVRQATMLGVSRTFISKTSKNQDTAWNFLVFTHSLPNMVSRYKLAGSIPPLKSFAETPEAKSDVLFQSFLNNVQFGVQWPPVAKWNDIRAFFTKMSDAFLAQDGPVNTIVKDTAKEINKILQS